MSSDGQEPERSGAPSVNWRRFAALFSGVITGVALIRLAADAAGIARGTTGSVVVSALSNFEIILAIGIATPTYLYGCTEAPRLASDHGFVTLRGRLRPVQFLVTEGFNVTCWFNQVAGAGLIVCCMLPATVHAQPAWPLPVGARVRLEFSDTVRQVPIGSSRYQLTGQLLADSSGAYLLRLPTGDLVSVRQSAVKNAWTSSGVLRRRSILVTSSRFAIGGLIVGGSVGAEDNTRGRLIGTAIGAGVGAIIGVLRPYEFWRRVRR